MKNTPKEERHLIVKGEVQGVGFRATTISLAKKLDITGTVQNLADGTVEIYAQGTQQQLDQLLHQLEERFVCAPVQLVCKPISQVFDTFKVL